ncbi:G_PROTEIN_RECEP_F1_2 domain-containing protein [Meloidogyne graminicola]|uniref:G_PROTEIN_RECEP_F1_2 domain-containing protein n=1 Tax=Meloidogyne graminicola TaxID=189291 RepID=A0A8S9ZW22_9BILA|nr:G_PROTEIN_RECEP_F1_2 domain-containing protein [Meloidogyne graminicola]
MEFPQLNCTLLDNLFYNSNILNRSATLFSKGTANAVSDMALTVGNVDYFIQHYIFPFQFFLGVFGNSINLIVLLSSGMKNQANILLAAMACADLAFLFCLLPNSLVSFPIFYRSIGFAYFYFITKIHFIAFANCFSTAATFFVLAVSLERFIGVWRPMHTCFQLRNRSLFLLILNIFIFAFLLSFYHHIEHKVTIQIQCNKVWANFQHISQQKNISIFLIKYLKIAKYIQSLFVIILPVIAVAILNVSLVYFLRKRRRILKGKRENEFKEQEFRYSDIEIFQKRERKVTATVIAIVTCFTITHLPTLGPIIFEHFLPNKYKIEIITVKAILNCILVTGKVLNFFCFCSSSEHFRKRTVLILKAQLCQNRSRKKYSSMVALSNLATQTNLTLIQNNNLNRKNSSSNIIKNNNSRNSHSITIINQQQPIYRVQKQSILSLREALLRQSGAEFDDNIEENK